MKRLNPDKLSKKRTAVLEKRMLAYTASMAPAAPNISRLTVSGGAGGSGKVIAHTYRLCIRNPARHGHPGGRSRICYRPGAHGCAHQRTDTGFTQPRFDRSGGVAAELDIGDRRIRAV